MKTVDVKVFGKMRKYGRLPEYERNPGVTHMLYRNVPVFLVTPEEMDAAICLEDVDVIRDHKREPLLVLTDRQRVLAIDPQGYDYPRYVLSLTPIPRRTSYIWFKERYVYERSGAN